MNDFDLSGVPAAQSPGSGGESNAHFSLRTPLTLAVSWVYAIGIGFGALVVTRNPVNGAFAVVGSVLLVTTLWLVSYHLYVPRRIQISNGSFHVYTRGGVQRVLSPVEFTFALSRYGWFGASLAYTTKTAPKRRWAVSLTRAQAVYVLRGAPDLFARSSGKQPLG